MAPYNRAVGGCSVRKLGRVRKRLTALDDYPQRFHGLPMVIYSVKQKDSATMVFRCFLAAPRADICVETLSVIMEVVTSRNKPVCSVRLHHITQKFSTTGSPQFNGIG